MKLDEYERLVMTLGKQCSTLAFLQSVFAFRINELLSLTRSDLSEDGFLYVKGSKGSNGRIVYVPFLLQDNRISALSQKQKLFSISYAQYYRSISRLVPARPHKKGRKNRAVTHYFRHIRAQANERLAHADYEAQKGFTGHRSSRGLSYYLTNSKLSRTGQLESINKP